MVSVCVQAPFFHRSQLHSICIKMEPNLRYDLNPILSLLDTSPDQSRAISSLSGLPVTRPDVNIREKTNKRIIEASELAPLCF